MKQTLRVSLFSLLILAIGVSTSSLHAVAVLEEGLVEGIGKAFAEGTGVELADGMETTLSNLMKQSVEADATLGGLTNGISNMEDKAGLAAQAGMREEMSSFAETTLKNMSEDQMSQIFEMENDSILRFKDGGDAAFKEAVMKKLPELRTDIENAAVTKMTEVGISYESAEAIIGSLRKQGDVAGGLGGGLERAGGALGEGNISGGILTEEFGASEARDALEVNQNVPAAVKKIRQTSVLDSFKQFGGKIKDFTGNVKDFGEQVFSSKAQYQRFGTAQGEFEAASKALAVDEHTFEVAVRYPDQDLVVGKCEGACTIKTGNSEWINRDLQLADSNLKSGDAAVVKNGEGKFTIKTQVGVNDIEISISKDTINLKGATDEAIENYLTRSIKDGDVEIVRQGDGYAIKIADGADCDAQFISKDKIPTEESIADRVATKEAHYNDMLQASTNIRKVARFFSNIGGGIATKTLGLLRQGGELLAQALVFTLPNILYQQTVDAQQGAALLETIGAIQQFGNLHLQIPSALISKVDPLRSIFIYVQVPGDNGGKPYGPEYFTPDVLKNASFFVAYGGSYGTWGATYIGSSTFTGQMVCLNNGWIFTGDGISVDAQNPVALLRPEGQKTVETFLNTLVAGEGSKFEHNVGPTDWIPLGIQQALGFAKDPQKGTQDLPQEYQDLFATHPVTNANNALPGASAFVRAPILFSQAIEQFRNPIKLQNFGSLQIKQMTGLGFRTALLSNQLDLSNPTIKAALDNLEKAQKAYDVAMSGDGLAADGVTAQQNTAAQENTEQETAAAALASAQQQVAQAIKGIGVDDALFGFHPQDDICTRGIYIYEIANDGSGTSLTPILSAFGKKVLPILPTEYVVCLNGASQIIPLMIPTVVKLSEGSGDTAQSVSSAGPHSYGVSLIPNPDIMYISSLTTGITWQKNASSSLVPVMQNGAIDYTKATNAFNAVLKLLTNEGKGILNQIIAMANYVSQEITEGPFATIGGNLLERVPLEELIDAGTSVTQGQPLLSDMSAILSGVVSASGAQEKLKTFSNDQQKQLLPNVYIYRVTNKNGQGALSYTGADGKIVDVPDYIVPVVVNSTSTKFQIVPLGVNPLTGTLGSSNTFYFSLITGRAYDADYNPLARWYTVDVIPRNPTTYFPLDGSSSGNYEGLAVGDTAVTLNLPVKSATTGAVTVQPTQVKMFPHVWLGTAYMPTVFNPYNRIFSNSTEAQALKTQYDQAVQTITQKSQQLSTLQAAFAGVPISVIQYVLSSAQNGQVSAAILKSAGFPNPDAMANTANAYLASNPTGSDYASLARALTDAQSTLNTLELAMNTTPGVLIPRTVGAMNIPPLYYLFFSNFEICTSGGATTFSIPSSSDSGTSLSWANMQPCKSGQPLGKADSTGAVTYLPLAALLPGPFSGFNLAQIIDPTTQGAAPQFYNLANDKNNNSYMSIRAAYEKWALGQEATNYWSQTALMGPINFTQRSKNNVYISTTRENAAGGFFFYSATGFPATSVFVCATGPKDGNVTSIDQLADIGKPYQPGDGTGVYLIDVGTGLVYKPYGTSPLAVPTGCTGINCSLQAVGQNQLRLDLDEVVRRALTNQGHTPSSGDLLSVLPTALQDQIKNAQSAARAQMAAAMSVTFGGMNLTLNTDQFNRGSYIYAEGSGAYMQATDYFAVFIDSYDSVTKKTTIRQIGATPINDTTSCIVSLVTGIKYYRTGAPVTDYFVDRVEQPNLLPNLLLSYVKRGNYSPDTGTYLPVDPGTAIAQRIQDLNTQYLAQLAAEKAAYVPSVLDTVPALTPAMVASAVPAGGAGKNLYKIGSKYYLKVQVSSASTNASGAQTETVTDVWFDFNATTDPKDADLGVYYMQQTDASGTVTYKPMNPISGFTLKAVRLHYGVTVDAGGSQTLSMPVDHLSIPLAPNETTLVPVDANGVPQFGQDGGYMKYQNRKTVDADRGLTYWYYYHTNINAYFALIQDTVGVIGGNDPTYGAVGKPLTILAPPYFAEFSSGDEYGLNGQPRMQKVTGAYARVDKPLLWPNKTTAPELPLSKLVSAQPVAGRPNLYLVDGKYYAKEVVESGFVIDQDGNAAQPLTKGVVTRWVDFNGNTEVNPIVGADSKVGSYYQIFTDSQTGLNKAVPICSIFTSNYALRNLRLTYGVQVAPDGTQTLIDPVVNGVDIKWPIFVWSDAESYDSFGALNVLADIQGIGQYVFYMYVPYYSKFMFVDSSGANISEISYDVQSVGDSTKLGVIKKTYPVGYSSKAVTTQLQDFTDVAKAATVYQGAINDLLNSGAVLVQIEHQVSVSGGLENSFPITEGTLAPKIYTVNGIQYTEGGYPYQTVFSDAPGDKAENDALLQGIPFVADSKGSRAAGSTGAPTGTSAYGTPLCGVLDNNSLMLGFIASNDGLFYRTNDPKIGAPNTYTAQALQPDGSYKQVSLLGSTIEYSNQSDKGVSAGYYFTLKDTAGSQESVYSPEIAYLPDQLLQALRQDTNVVSTPLGLVLESRINISDLQPATTNLAPGSMSSTYIKSVAVPAPKILYQVPTLDVVTAYYQSNPAKYPNLTTALAAYNASVGLLTPGMYVDYVNGAVFSVDGNTLYPTGLGVGSDGLKVIKDQFGGAVAGTQNGVLQLGMPSVSTGG